MRIVGRWCALVVAAITALAAAPRAQAQLYAEDFVGAALADVGWSDAAATAASAGLFDHTGIALANEATTPDGVDTGAVFHYLNVNGVRAITTTEFAPISTGGVGVDVIWYQTEDALVGGSTIDVHPAVMVGGQWYASASGYATTDATDPWQRHVLAYSSTAANWRTLTLDAGFATLGAAPGANLAGDIAGLGLVTVMSSARLGNETVWYDHIQVAAHLQPGDVNGGGVGIDDYNIIRGNYRTVVASRSLGDLNADGFVDIVDFREWKANFPGAAEALGLTIPEPSSCLLTLSGLALGGTRRRVLRRCGSRLG